MLKTTICQDLKRLDDLISKRLDIITQLERSMYSCAVSGDRPTLQPPRMDKETDAIRYYSELLDEYNTNISNEKKRVVNLSLVTEYKYQNNPLSVVENFVEVEEAGTLQSLLQDRKESSRRRIKMNKTDRKEEAGSNRVMIDPRDLEEFENSEDSKTHKYFAMSWLEWLAVLASSTTFSDFVANVSRGRSYEHTLEESSAFVSSYKDRKHFLSKAFISFKTFYVATIAKQVIHSQKKGALEIVDAPEPNDIIVRIIIVVGVYIITYN